MSASSILDTIAPQFSEDSSKADVIILAQQQTSASFFGSNYDLAVAYRAAHMMTLFSRQNGAPGNISAKRIGPITLQYTAGGGQENLLATSYGRFLTELMKSRQPLPYVSGTYGLLGLL